MRVKRDFAHAMISSVGKTYTRTVFSANQGGSLTTVIKRVPAGLNCNFLPKPVGKSTDNSSNSSWVVQSHTFTTSPVLLVAKRCLLGWMQSPRETMLVFIESGFERILSLRWMMS
jgi:hypothetical protein